MAIIFPKNLRGKGVTAGSLRQVKQNGFSDNGELIADEFVKGQIEHRGIDFFLKNEPAGVFMGALDNTKIKLNENTEAIRIAGCNLVETARNANKQMTEVSGKFRDGTEKLGKAIDKFMAVVGKGDFLETVKLTESLVSSLERLAILEEKGLLDKVMKAMR